MVHTGPDAGRQVFPVRHGYCEKRDGICRLCVPGPKTTWRKRTPVTLCARDTHRHGGRGPGGSSPPCLGDPSREPISVLPRTTSTAYSSSILSPEGGAVPTYIQGDFAQPSTCRPGPTSTWEAGGGRVIGPGQPATPSEGRPGSMS